MCFFKRKKDLKANIDVKEYIIAWARDNITFPDYGVPVDDEYLGKVADIFCEKARTTKVGALSLYDRISNAPSKVKNENIKKVWESAEYDITYSLVSKAVDNYFKKK